MMLCGGVSHAQSSGEVRLNHIQVVGSHNSYKEAIDPPLLDLIRMQDASRARSLDYHHISLMQQLELGLRNLELDVFYDPEGGRFATPFGLKRVQGRGAHPAPYDPLGTMHAPGFKVMHVQDLDFRSTCLTLQLCLDEILLWSNANPEHIPLFITVNAKDDLIDIPGFTAPLPFDAVALDSLDAAIRAFVPSEKLLEPDDVRGTHASLPEALQRDGWPLLDAVRGKLVLVLDEGGPKQAAYLKEHPALERRAMFVAAPEDSPAAAIMILNDPVGQGAEIRRLVEAGFIIRTRADAGTFEARRNDTTRREAAFASGAHIISTDYYQPNPAFEGEYQVRLPDGRVALCHPQLAPSTCQDVELEQP